MNTASTDLWMASCISRLKKRPTLFDEILAIIFARIVAKKGAEKMTDKKKRGPWSLEELAKELQRE
jgi:hypothetical protein